MTKKKLRKIEEGEEAWGKGGKGKKERKKKTEFVVCRLKQKEKLNENIQLFVLILTHPFFPIQHHFFFGDWESAARSFLPELPDGVPPE